MEITEPSRSPYDVRTFTGLLARVGEQGALEAALTNELREIVAALQDAAMDGNGKAKASLKVEITFGLDGGMVKIGGNFKTSLPKAKDFRSHLFVTPDNFLTMINPRQRELPLTTVATSHGEAVRVS